MATKEKLTVTVDDALPPFLKDVAWEYHLPLSHVVNAILRNYSGDSETWKKVNAELRAIMESNRRSHWDETA